MLAGNKNTNYLCGIIFAVIKVDVFSVRSLVSSLVSSLVGSLVSVVEKGCRQAALFFFLPGIT